MQAIYLYADNCLNWWKPNIHNSIGDCDAAGIFDARWLASATEPALAVALSSGHVQLVLVSARDEHCTLEAQGTVNIPSGAMVLSLDVCEKEAACMAASTSAGELTTMKVALCPVHRLLIKGWLEEPGYYGCRPTVGWPVCLDPRRHACVK